MEQSQIYENFVRLFSADSDERLNALLSKKDWILDRYYLPFTFVSVNGDGNYSDLEGLMKQGLLFRPLPRPRLAEADELQKISLFNDRFRYVKMYERLPKRPDRNTFFVEVNFKKLDRDDYRTLVSNFFYCLNRKVIAGHSFNSKDIRSVLLTAMLGSEEEAVLILDKHKLDKNIFKIDGMTKIYLYDDIAEKEEAIINRIAYHTNLKVVMVHG